MSTKRKLELLTEHEKIWLAHSKQKNGWTLAQCRSAFRTQYPDKAEFKLPDGTLSGIVGKNHIGQWLAREQTESTTYRERSAQQPKLEHALLLWLNQKVHEQGATVSDQVAIEKARELAPAFNVPDTFKFSNGWLSNFKRRNGVRQYTKSGEAASADLAGVERARTDLCKITDLYALCDTYNYDETGLNYRQQPNKTLATRRLAGGKVRIVTWSMHAVSTSQQQHLRVTVNDLRIEEKPCFDDVCKRSPEHVFDRDMVCRWLRSA
jgi:hypothetical protein